MMRLCIVALLALGPASASAHELGLHVRQSSTLGPNIAAAAGARWVRIDFSWADAQPTAGPIIWTTLDAAVNAARAKGLNVLAVIANTPAWASASDVDPSTHRNDLPIAGGYATFVQLAVSRFKDRVTTYELWNEENLPAFWEGTATQYVDLILKPGAAAVHAACPTCLVLSGGLSSSPASGYDSWLEAILQQAKDVIDGVAGHIYAGFTEDDPTLGVTADSFLNLLDIRRVVTTGGAPFTGPRSFKEVMDDNGFAKPFWLTATGALADPGSATALARQRTYYRHVLEKAALRPFWTHTFFDEAYDDAGGTRRYGIAVEGVAGTYTKKPAFDLLALAGSSTALGGATPECADGLDNDEDGLIDFPDDTDCFDPTTTSEGPYSLPDFASASRDLAGSDAAPDGGSQGTGGVPGQKPTTEPTRGCTYAGAEESAPLALALVLVACFALLSRRRA